MLTIPRQTTGGVFKPRTLSLVFRMMLQCTVAQVAGIAVIGGCLRSTGNDQVTVTAESEKGFSKNSIGSSQTTRRCKPSLEGSVVRVLMAGQLSIV